MLQPQWEDSREMRSVLLDSVIFTPYSHPPPLTRVRHTNVPSTEAATNEQVALWCSQPSLWILAWHWTRREILLENHLPWTLATTFVAAVCHWSAPPFHWAMSSLIDKNEWQALQIPLYYLW